ncbi:hypothetical protein AGRA3207_004753 [Actinomadura graeca]|uniref:Squalene cyclase C-terminal domain-containing protein n=2 Tax=Actinomadura graeca TaxID=2750812 RepID=A0ABX8R6J6_9ACTN|nr:hypothetical protein AGRA3207_004753 [Actinomadura graeca]
MPAARATEVIDIPATVRDLVGSLLTAPWGQVSASVYETGRLVTLAPWLTGHQRRLAYLVGSQRPDGGWGGPCGYSIVPTLSAVEAVLASLGRVPTGEVEAPGTDDAGEVAPYPGPAVLLGTAERGLRLLFRLLPSMDASAVPDTPALDLIVAALTDAINGHLDGERSAPPTALARVTFSGRLSPPAGVDGARLAMVRAAMRGGTGLPVKILHALEVTGSAARGHPAIRPEHTGTVGASAAATAAWLGDATEDGGRDEVGTDGPRARARRFLENVVNEHGDLAPCGIPVTAFERSWVLSGLARAGLTVRAPRQIVVELASALGPNGAAAADGLPADADTTAMSLYALGLLGMPHTPDPLWQFETETHFCTWQGEQGFSVTVNAHVLDAFGQHLRAVRGAPSTVGASADRCRAAVGKVTRLLCDRQRTDGSWRDRWHASPYYATVCCALALGEFGGSAAVDTVQRAREWVVNTQRPDGSWGLWDGSAEETAYGLQILALTGSARGGVEESFTRGYKFLLEVTRDTLEKDSGPALWHDKDLYYPRAIVRAAVMSALHLADTSRPARGRIADDR